MDASIQMISQSRFHRKAGAAINVAQVLDLRVLVADKSVCATCISLAMRVS
jgi:hypothetical protein